jgi:hypothetical protein
LRTPAIFRRPSSEQLRHHASTVAAPFRTETNMPTLTTCLWFDDQALDTAG